MNACQDQGREAVTTESEDAQKTLGSQLADNSMTTVKTPNIWFVFILLHLKFLSRQPVVL